MPLMPPGDRPAGAWTDEKAVIKEKPAAKKHKGGEIWKRKDGRGGEKLHRSEVLHKLLTLGISDLQSELELPASDGWARTRRAI